MGWVSLQATLFRSSFPYTLFVDAKPNGAWGWGRRTASSTLRVPAAFTSKSVIGSSSEVVTATWPARCRIASWFLTCCGRAKAFLTSSLTKVVRAGCFVINHLRFRSVPGRLRLSSSVTCHPSAISRTAALTPRKPAPPVMRTRRSRAPAAAREGRVSGRDDNFGSLISVVGSIGGTYVKTTRSERPRWRGCRLRHSVHPLTRPYHRRVPPSERSMSAPDARLVRSNWESEVRMADVYEALAGTTRDTGLKHRLMSLAATEKRHADAWAALMDSGDAKPATQSRQLTARFLAMLARVAGIGPALALAGAAEGQVLRSYLNQVATVSDERAQGVLRKVLPEELDHQSAEDVTSESPVEPSPEPAMYDAGAAHEPEEWHGGGIESIRNVIYGVNDGLTATLGVLAGVGGASVSPRVVLIGGLSAMVASGVSMAGGAYLSSKSQREVYEGQLAREAAEIEAMPQLERAELVKS